MQDTTGFIVVIFATICMVYKLFSDRLYIDKLERLLEQIQTKNEELNAENTELAEVIAVLQTGTADQVSDHAN